MTALPANPTDTRRSSELSAAAPASGRGLKPFPCANLRLTRTTPRHKLMAPRTRQSKPPRDALTGATADSPSSPPAFFLRTKVLPPRPSAEMLSRPRLTEKLLANLAHPVTLVTA